MADHDDPKHRPETGNDADPRPLSRRQLLERTGAALGLVTLGGCVEESAAGGNPPDPAGGPPPPPTQPGGESGAPNMPPGTATNEGAVTGMDPMPAPPQAGSPASDPENGMGDPPPPADPTMAEPTGPGDMQPEPSEDDPPEPTASPTGVPVAFVRRDNLDAAVTRAVELAGGIDEIQPGQTVFIKPNAVSDRAIGTPGIRTSNEVLAAVVRLIKRKNPGRIIVGDRAARGFESDAVFSASGMGEAAMAAGADEIYATPPAGRAEDDHWMLVQPPNYEEVWESAGGILVMRKIMEADHLINVPTCKNHRFAQFSLTLKNFVGGIGDTSRDPLHYLSSIGQDFEPLGRDIALLNQPFSPLVNIVDATTVLVNGGPQGSGTDAVRVAAGLIMASKDRIAADTAGLALIKHELGRTDVTEPDSSHRDLMSSTSVWGYPQIENAVELGLGVQSPDEASLVFDGVDDADAMAVEALFRS